uniref:Uncharacterized protein n=1 Tax=Arundo donax TaxID=35708 RepID=A0A0A9C8I6_ARUDO
MLRPAKPVEPPQVCSSSSSGSNAIPGHLIWGIAAPSPEAGAAACSAPTSTPAAARAVPTHLHGQSPHRPQRKQQSCPYPHKDWPPWLGQGQCVRHDQALRRVQTRALAALRPSPAAVA